MKRLLIFCLSFWLLISCQSERQWYQKTIAAEDKKELAESIANGGGSNHYQGSVPEQFHLMEALSLDSSNGDLWREMGTARVKRGIADEMHYYYGKAAAIKPDPWMGFRGYLYLYFYRDYERAIADFNQLDSLTGSVGNSQAQDHDYMRGIAYYGLKDYTSASNYLQKYINRISAEVGSEWVDVNAYLYLALAQYNQEDQKASEEAIEALKRGLALYPNYADLHYHLARIYFHKSEWQKSRSHLQKAKQHFEEGFYHYRPYVEVLEQIYPQDLEELEKLLTS